MRRGRKASTSSSHSSGGGGGGGAGNSLDETGIPNEAVLKSIEQLGYTCAVHQVVAATGLPHDAVEAEMAALLRESNGFFAIATTTDTDTDTQTTSTTTTKNNKQKPVETTEIEYAANVFNTDTVSYVYPPGLRNLLRRRFVLMRLRDALGGVVGLIFKLLRISFGILLLLSLLIVCVVVIIVIARSGGNGGDHRHGHGFNGLDAFRIMHRPRRHYNMGGNNDWFFWWWWWNNNPFFFGLANNQAHQQRWQEAQERRRRMLNALDEEEGGEGGGGGGQGQQQQQQQGDQQLNNSRSTRRRAGSSSSSSFSVQRLPGEEEEGGGGGGEGTEGEDAVEEDMSFLEAVFSLLFGDGAPGPSENQRWQCIAKKIHDQQGIVCSEEILPLLSQVDPLHPDKSMLSVCARFGGKPVRCVDGRTGKDCGYLYDFVRMREGALKSGLVGAGGGNGGGREAAASMSVSGGREEKASLLAGAVVMGEGEKNETGVNEEEHTHTHTYIAPEGGEEDLDDDDDDPLDTTTSSPSTYYLQEHKYVFSRAPLHLLQLSGALGLINLVGAFWLSDQWSLFPEPGATALYVTGRILLFYSLFYLLVPLGRLALISYYNRGIDERNFVRKYLWEEWTQARADGKSVAAMKAEEAWKARRRVGGGLSEVGKKEGGGAPVSVVGAGGAIVPVGGGGGGGVSSYSFSSPVLV